MRRPGLTIQVRIEDDGVVVTVRGREAWAVIETIRERHGGAFPGDHARYVLRSRITVLDKLGAAA